MLYYVKYTEEWRCNFVLPQMYLFICCRHMMCFLLSTLLYQPLLMLPMQRLQVVQLHSLLLRSSPWLETLHAHLREAKWLAISLQGFEFRAIRRKKKDLTSIPWVRLWGRWCPPAPPGVQTAPPSGSASPGTSPIQWCWCSPVQTYSEQRCIWQRRFKVSFK